MEGLITYLEGQQAKKHAEHDTAVKGDLEFLAGVAAHGQSVVNAWRNRVAHIERAYSEEEAERILLATQVFMSHLAQKLKAPDDPS